MLDRYHSERTGTDYENQSATVFIIPNHGSEVLNRRDQRVFFFRRSGSVYYRSRQRKKKPSGTQGKREAVILKICPPAIITSAEVIIAEYDAILGQ